MTTEDARKLFVAGLPESMTEDVLRQLFEATGSQVIELSLPRDRATGRPRGFGFVTLQTREQADEARSVLDGSIQAGRAISVRPFQAGSARKEPKAENQPATPVEDRTLYVGNLPYDATADEVEQLLEQAGVSPVLRVHLPMGPDGRPRGFGFVALSSPDAVTQAIPALQSSELRGRRVMVKVAHPRGTAPTGGGPGGPGPRGGGGYQGGGGGGYQGGGGGGYQGGGGGGYQGGGGGGYQGGGGGGYQGGGGGGYQGGGGYAGSSRPGPRVDGGGPSEIPPPRAYRAAEPSTDFEEEEGGEGAAAKASSKTKPAVAPARGKAAKPAAKKGKGERAGAEERRSRGGGASWQRWEDWDDE